MSAKDEMLKYLWKESTVDMKLVNKCIAAVQLEAVEEYIKHEELAHAVAYLAELRKAAGKGE